MGWWEGRGSEFEQLPTSSAPLRLCVNSHFRPKPDEVFDFNRKSARTNLQEKNCHFSQPQKALSLNHQPSSINPHRAPLVLGEPNLNTPSRSALFCPIQRYSAIFSAIFISVLTFP